MKNFCYVLVNQSSLNCSVKDVLKRVQSVSNNPKGCSVVRASRAYYSHFDFAVICGNFVKEWPSWLQFSFIVCVSDSQMEFVLLKLGVEVEYFLTVPDRSFVTPEMASLMHGYKRIQSSLPANTRHERRQVWRDRMHALLEPYRNIRNEKSV